MSEPSAADVRAVATLSRATLTSLAGADWSIRAGELDWSARQTLEHMAHALNHYAVQLASHAQHRVLISRTNADPTHTIVDMLAIMEARAAILADVITMAPPSVRAFHSAGMADPAGFAAMACDELLIHTDDLMRGFGRTFRPPDEVCRRVVTRLFPWAPPDAEPWPALQWANGRAALPNRARLGPDWLWQCAPLAEWDGTTKRQGSTG